jgi:hypothetical protein
MYSGDPVDMIWGYLLWLLEERRIMLPWVLRDGRARSTVDILEAKKGRHERTSKQENRRRGIHKKKAIHRIRKRVKTKGSDYRIQSCGSAFIE